MGKIKDKISEEIKTAMKAQNKDRLSVLRMMLSELKYAASQENVHAEMSDEADLKVVSSYHKKLAKSREEYPDEESKQRISKEILIVEEFMPKRASEEEIVKMVDTVLAGTSDRNFGALMREVVAKLGGSADGKLVSEILKKKLGT
jgi:uncharacterized protein YqeY